jgi:glycogen debranching enzyme
MITDTVSILEGSTFVVTDRRGDVDASPTEAHGLFNLDTRFLSRWRMRVNGRSLNVLSIDAVQYNASQFFLVPGTGTIYVDADLSVIRKRTVGDGFHEDLTVMNHGHEPRELEIRIDAASDFADLFEVKDALTKKGRTYAKVQNGGLLLGYQRERFVRETWITASFPADFDDNGLTFHVRVEPHGQWSSCLDVATLVPGASSDHRGHPKYAHGEEARPEQGESLSEWVREAPELVTSWRALDRTYRQSLVDLAALRFFPRMMPGAAMPAAGLPWFMAIFGRDSIITSLQALPFAPELTRTTLKMLAARQGMVVDDFREEEPGKIIHEIRFGELTAFEERPHSPYYGAADSTPLFLVLLDEYERWSGDTALVQELESAARAALDWIDRFGDRNGDGYVDYQRTRETGLENQCWKDSPGSIVFADGSMSALPRATCEIQGYVYDAKKRAARLAREIWRDPALAQRLEADAAALKARFNRDYWLADREYFALAIDGHGRPVDSLTSNIGHLLWSGIVDDDKIEAVVAHLMSERLFSGWGVRTMAEGDGAYNPIGYHVGTVWPHDNSIIALGLRRAGYRDEAAKIALAMLQAARFFNGRLPEAFAGYQRNLTSFPVEYPTACSPQAWATGTPLLLLRTLLGLEPIGDRLLDDPAIPSEIGDLQLLDIPGRWGRADAFGRPVAGNRHRFRDEHPTLH